MGEDFYSENLSVESDTVTIFQSSLLSRIGW